MDFSPPKLTDEKADALLYEIMKLTDNHHLRLVPIDERFSGNPLDAWRLYGDLAVQIAGSYKADVVISYLDHLMDRYRSLLGRSAPSKPVFGERRDPVRDLKMSLVLASLGVLREEYLGT